MTKILLVEDDKSLREIYGVRLLAEGYDIVSAGDGEEALAMAIKEKPQLIISDVMMPKISGFDMLDILRSTTETRDIRVIMMTALSSDDQRARGEQLGADKYLVKSQVGIEDVVRTVHEVLNDKNGTAVAAGAAVAAVTESPAPEAPAALETTSEPTESPVEAVASVGPTVEAAPVVETPATDTEPVVASPVAESVEASSLAPGNADAGPLPPQPSEVQSPESTLPEPTAPFASPRPSNLGENALHPEDSQEPAVAPLAEEQALEVPSDPSVTPVESQAPAVEPSLDAPVEAPVVAEDAGLGLNFGAVAPAEDTTPPVDSMGSFGAPVDAPAPTEPTEDSGTAPVSGPANPLS